MSHSAIKARVGARGKSEYLTMENISEHAYTCPEDMPQDLRALIDRLLQQQPAKRIGFSDVQELKQHPFFHGAHYHAATSSASYRKACTHCPCPMPRASILHADCSPVQITEEILPVFAAC